MTARLKALGRVVLFGLASAVLPQPALAQTVDPLEGQIVREVRVIGLRNLPLESVERHLSLRVGVPFRRAMLAVDQRRLDELRLFSSVVLEAQAESGGVVVKVTLTETLRLLPVVLIRVTDENGVSAGPGIRGINLFGHEAQTAVSVLFGGETGISAVYDVTTITPATWTEHFGFNYSERRNSLYDFDERSLSADARVARNLRHGLRIGGTATVLTVDTGTSGQSLSPDGEDIIPTLGGYLTLDTLDSSTNPRAGTWAEAEVDRQFGDASSWTFIADGRRFQRLSERNGLGIFSLVTSQTGEVNVTLPDYLQFALGGANTVRGWTLGSRQGRNQFIGTLEYTYVLRPATSFSVANVNLYAGLQLVGFGDVGATWTDWKDLKRASAIDGYGVGLRVLVPFVDVIRLDLAWGEPGRGATAYFSVSLKATRQRQRVR